MSSPTVSLKVVTTAGGTWTPALCAATTAPVLSVENPMVAPIQQVAAQTSGPVQSAFVTVPASSQQQPQPLLIQPVTTQSESHSAVPPTHGVRHGQKFGRANTKYIVYNNYNSL